MPYISESVRSIPPRAIDLEITIYQPNGCLESDQISVACELDTDTYI